MNRTDLHHPLSRPASVPRPKMARRLARTALLAMGALAAMSAGLAQAADGEVRKVDRAQAKVTIRHGAIGNLDMPAMTMVFKARPASLLDGLAEGDRISFEAAKVDGQYTVTAIRKLP
jgi:Cu/Ag efflux protein CusF